MNIGLTQTIIYHNNRAYDSIEHDWYRYLKGHTLSIIRNDITQDFTKIATNLDLLIITGGSDHARRRAVELKLASEMMKRIKPILGVCHGALLMTDILGGEISEDQDHLNTDHKVLCEGDLHWVNSHHSNVISKPHDDAKIIATDDCGRCEAWIDNNLAGIMWHPQRMETPFLPLEIANMAHL